MLHFYWICYVPNLNICWKKRKKKKKRKALLLLSISDDAAHYITVTIIAFYIPTHTVLLLV